MKNTLICSAEDLKTHLDNPNVKVVDVRTYPEYVQAHLPGSQLIPLDELKKDPSILEGADKIVLICRTGRRANEAAAHLQQFQPCETFVLDGGIEALKQSGYPLNSLKGPISLERQVRIAAGGLVLLGLIAPGLKFLPYVVGAGLVFAGVTDTCGMAMVLARLPWNRARGTAATCSSPGSAS